MKMYAIISLILFIIMLLFPLLAMKSTVADNQSAQEETIDVLMTSSGKVKSLDMEKYIIGVVAAEMSPSYHEQALMAQAVASYTYALSCMKSSETENADITDSSAKNQAYLSEEQLKEKWGDKYDYYIKKIEKAVKAVNGQYVSYNGQPIKAAYHALNTGRTESAANVWGGEIPYLVSVESIGDTLSPQYSSVRAFNSEQFKNAASSLNDIKLSQEESSWVGESEASESKTVKSIKIGEQTYTGEEVRAAFSLKSAAFTLKYKDGIFTFTVYGYGHMVGMSQYGADYMARQGSTYKEILLHYYPKTTITQ